MKFKVDENLPKEVATTLIEAGFDAHTVRDESLSGVDDRIVSSTAKREGRVLITLDLDFANIQAYPPDEAPGILVLRLKRQDAPTVVSYVRRLIPVLKLRNPAGQLWIVERDRVRFR